ncbi:MAG: HPr family phosphocarrier protein [Lactobacillales bacterium]|jgi:phosphocarrier protein|nr:HPr family phosphocarrier protein [Lactobacillales bacterium]
MSDTVSKEVTLQNLKGLHARATSAFVKVAEGFKSDITLQKEDGTSVCGKSIMGILMLGMPMGESLTITATGDDAAAAVQALSDLVDAKFGEDA